MIEENPYEVIANDVDSYTFELSLGVGEGHFVNPVYMSLRTDESGEVREHERITCELDGQTVMDIRFETIYPQHPTVMAGAISAINEESNPSSFSEDSPSLAYTFKAGDELLQYCRDRNPFCEGYIEGAFDFNAFLVNVGTY